MTGDVSERFLTLHELITAAEQNLNRNAWDYLRGAAESETTLKRNRYAIDAIAFRPRVLRDVSKVDCTGRLLGVDLRIPVVMAPIGSLESFDPGGGATVAKAAAEFGSINILSSACLPGLEDVAAAADNAMIYQLYVRGDDDWVDDHARRAIAAGYHAFCITVDVQHYSRRERDISKRHVTAGRARSFGPEFQAAFSWDHVKRFRDKHDIPLILKGIATAEDAVIACEHGVAAVYVSNHGGRQLDHGRGSIEVLPEIVEAVAGRAEIMVDGGFMRGADVVKAIIMGADAVGIGRLQGAAVAAAGQAGVVRALELLEIEIRIALGLLGVTNFAELDASYLHPAVPMTVPHVFSAFPLLEEGY